MAEQMMQDRANEKVAKQTIPAGYKLTEVGVIPDDWVVSTMSSLTSLMTNGFVGTAKTHYTEAHDGVTYIQGYNVEENKFNFHGIKKVSAEFHRKNAKSCLRAGDLLMVQTGDVGIVTVVPPELEGANCHALIINRFRAEYNSAYFSFLFNSQQGRLRLKELETGTTMKHINVGDLLNFVVAYPPDKVEQTAIANVLSDTDALIDALEQLIAKKQAIKTATMQQLLTGRTRLPQFALRADGTPKGYKTSELGQIPEDWTIETLGGVTEIVRNGSNYSSVAKDGVAVTRIETIATGYVDVGRTGVAVRESIHESYRVLRGDILYSHINSIDHIGKVARFDDDIELFHGINLILIRTSAVNSLWLFKLLSGEEARKWARQVAKQAVSQASINTKELKGLLLAVPSTQEQTTIATILSDMDSELTALEQKLAKARSLKQGMMQQLLTGRIRLPVEQVE